MGLPKFLCAARVLHFIGLRSCMLIRCKLVIRCKVVSKFRKSKYIGILITRKLRKKRTHTHTTLTCLVHCKPIK